MGLVKFIKSLFKDTEKETLLREKAAQDVQLEQYKKEMAKLLEEKKKREELDKEAENTQKVFDAIKANTTSLKGSELDFFQAQTQAVIQSMLASGQMVGATKAKWLADVVIPKEKELISLGVSKAVYRADIAKFISEHKTRAIKLVSVVDYTRIIPPHAVEQINKTKHIFNQFVIVYTDHSIQAAMEVAKRKDPILFGVFTETVPVMSVQEQRTSGIVNDAYSVSTTNKITVMSDRLYFLADWEDEHCDLTFDQMVREYKGITGKPLPVMSPDAEQAIQVRIQ